MTNERLITSRRFLYIGVFGLLVLGSFHLASNSPHAGEIGQYAFEAAVLIGFPTLMLFLLWAFERRSPRPGEYSRLAALGISGIAAAVFISGLLTFSYHLEGLIVPNLPSKLLIASDVGAQLGLLAGWKEVTIRRSVRRVERAETRATLSERHEQSLIFLNRILRHHVLNGLNVILGATNCISEFGADNLPEYIDIIEHRSGQMVEYVENIRNVVNTLADGVEIQQIDLSEILHRELESAQKSFPNTSFEGDIPTSVSVIGSNLTGDVFENLFENAVKHNRADEPMVKLDVSDRNSSVRVTVTDNGPGMSDRQKTAYFVRGEHGQGSLGEGLGLYFAETVISAGHGQIWIEDNEPHGTQVVVEFPKLEEVAPISKTTALR